MRTFEIFAASAAVFVTIITCLTVIGCSEAEAVDPTDEVVADARDIVGETALPGEGTTTGPAGEQGRAAAAADIAVPRDEVARRSPPDAHDRSPSQERAVEPQRRSRRHDEAVADAEPIEPELLEVDGLGIDRMVMAREIVDRSPVGEHTSFSAGDGERIYAYLEVANPEREEREITVAWVPADSPDREISRVEVRVGAHRRWRTWAYTSRLTRPGRYLAVIRDHEDRVIARAPFEVTL